MKSKQVKEGGNSSGAIGQAAREDSGCAGPAYSPARQLFSLSFTATRANAAGGGSLHPVTHPMDCWGSSSPGVHHQQDGTTAATCSESEHAQL